MNLRIIFEESFYFLTVFLIGSFLLELFWPRSVLAYFNLNLVLLLWLINVIILLGIKIKIDDGKGQN